MDDYYRGCVSLPLFPKMSDEEQEYVIAKLGEAVDG